MKSPSTLIGKSISFALHSLKDFERAETILPIVECLLKGPARLTKYGYDEADRRIESASEVVALISGISHGRKGQRMGGVSLKSDVGCDIQIRWVKTENPGFSLVFGEFARNRLINLPHGADSVVELFRDLIPHVDPVYGEIRDMSALNADLPVDLKTRLPDIPAISVYGPPYVEMFGEEKVRTAPFLSASLLPGGHYWLQATQTIVQTPSDAERAAIKAHLGDAAFMSGGKRLYRSGQSPRFDFSSLMP